MQCHLDNSRRRLTQHENNNNHDHHHSDAVVVFRALGGAQRRHAPLTSPCGAESDDYHGVDEGEDQQRQDEGEEIVEHVYVALSIEDVLPEGRASRMP